MVWLKWKRSSTLLRKQLWIPQYLVQQRRGKLELQWISLRQNLVSKFPHNNVKFIINCHKCAFKLKFSLFLVALSMGCNTSVQPTPEIPKEVEKKYIQEEPSDDDELQEVFEATESNIEEEEELSSTNYNQRDKDRIKAAQVGVISDILPEAVYLVGKFLFI
jgi:hypothetical protein